MTGQIFINGSGRFQIDTRELTAGDTLEVLIVDGTDNKTKWVSTSIDANDNGYYLTDIVGYSPVGLFARVN